MVDRDRSSPSVSRAGITKPTPRKKPVACRRCQSRKTKCSGQNPCQGCISAGVSDSCSYQFRDRTVKVSESYLQRILEENERAKQSPAASSPVTPSATVSTNPPEIPDSPAETALINPLIDDRAWFEPHTNVNLPVYIGEAACTAFTTRFRQALDVSTGYIPHISRFHHVSDEHLVSNPGSPSWPSKVKAQLLVKVALVFIESTYHTILTSVTLKRLDQIYEDKSCATAMDTCKFFLLFALGEVYSKNPRIGEGNEFPGLSYFVAASRFLRILPEKANLEHVENLMLMKTFCLSLYWNGCTISRTIGLHHNIPQSIHIDPVIRQHRIRLWWTIYYCDRIWASKLGHTSSLQTANISVELPSMNGLNDQQKEDFSDPDYAIASLKLAKIVGDTISRIYSRDDNQPFISAVRSILRDVKEWISNLPASLKLPSVTGAISVPRNIRTLHLSCNQCVILATRPVLLHILKESLVSSSTPSAAGTAAITPTISTLGETCIHTARHSVDILTQSWVNGTLTAFGYFYAHYLFSATVMLAISSMLNPTSSSSDSTAVETATEVLQTMADNGNLSAQEFIMHLKYLRDSMTTYWDHISGENTGVPMSRNYAPIGVLSSTTTEMALGETSMLNFLGQIDGGEFDFLNPFLGENSFMNTASAPGENTFS